MQLMTPKSLYAIMILLSVDTATFNDLILINLIWRLTGPINGGVISQVGRTLV
jgi:hypothetical protein